MVPLNDCSSAIKVALRHVGGGTYNTPPSPLRTFGLLSQSYRKYAPDNDTHLKHKRPALQPVFYVLLVRDTMRLSD